MRENKLYVCAAKKWDKKIINKIKKLLKTKLLKTAGYLDTKDQDKMKNKYLKKYWTKN